MFSIKLLFNLIEITRRHGFSPANLFHIFRTSFYKNISGGMLLNDGLNIVSVMHYEDITEKTEVVDLENIN